MKYRDAGVDIEKANVFVEKIKPFVKSTSRKGVIGNIGGFGGLFNLDTTKYKKPVLVASTDGVGTKLIIARMMDKHDTIGIDLVAMSANDLIVQGAEPLFFLDYIAAGKMDIDRSVAIVKGITEGCIEAGCALIGGENAEMPGFYGESEYDLAGFCVGIVESDKIIDGSEVSVGDRIIGLTSNGIHSNGLSLARKALFEKSNLAITDTIEGMEDSIGTELLRPTKIYVKTILNIVRDFTVKGMAHITGGGFLENIPRALPGRCKAAIIKNSWNIPPIFKHIQKMGGIDKGEMFKTFNMGIGMVIIAAKKDSQEVIDRLGSLGQEAFIIGSVTHRTKNEPSVKFE